MQSNSTGTETIGVLLLAFGGPESLDSVEPFMEKLMKGRKPTPEIIARAKEKYRLIGGKSPLPEITGRQANALEARLNETGSERFKFKVSAGMRYWHPFIQDAILQMESDGIKRAYAISMSPHHSRVSTGAYIDEIERVIAENNLNIRIDMVGEMYNHPIFIEAVTEKVRFAINEFPEENRKGVQVVFSAHSLPMSYIESGDPYVDEIRATIEGVLGKVDLPTWRLAYQSKGSIPGEWLGPMVEDVLQQIAGNGLKDVLLVPIGFAADHVETLWDLDILHKGQAEDLGLNYVRSGALNDSPKFIDTLASMVLDKVGEL